MNAKNIMNIIIKALKHIYRILVRASKTIGIYILYINASKGLKSAQYLLAMFYSGKRYYDYEKAMLWAQMAALQEKGETEQIHVPATKLLAEISYKHADYIHAKPVYERLAEMNCALACERLGNMYYLGQLGYSNIIKALDYYEKAAQSREIFNMTTPNFQIQFANILYDRSRELLEYGEYEQACILYERSHKMGCKKAPISLAKIIKNPQNIFAKIKSTNLYNLWTFFGEQQP